MSNEYMSLPRVSVQLPIFLRPCPFCGTVPEIEEIKSKGGLFRKKTTCFYVRCPVCRATSGVDYKKNKVAYLWNRRVENE